MSLALFSATVVNTSTLELTNTTGKTLYYTYNEGQDTRYPWNNNEKITLKAAQTPVLYVGTYNQTILSPYPYFLKVQFITKDGSPYPYYWGMEKLFSNRCRYMEEEPMVGRDYRFIMNDSTNVTISYSGTTEPVKE